MVAFFSIIGFAPSIAADQLLYESTASTSEYVGNVIGGYQLWNSGGTSCASVPDITINRMTVNLRRAPIVPAFAFDFGAQIVRNSGMNVYNSDGSIVARETYSATTTVAKEYAFTWDEPHNLRELCEEVGDSTFLGIGFARIGTAGVARTLTVPHFTEGLFHTGSGEEVAYDFAFKLYGPDQESEVPDPVIIIPGILGSEKNSDGEWVIDPILHTYDDLIATLDINHYTPGVDLFPFPYNWRNSNVETALLLKEKIDEVKEICECDKVDLVAHSMGGLVARQYIQSDAYEEDVDQLIFLGTPHLGAPKAYLMWEGGLSGLDWQDAPFNFILSQEAGEEGYSDVLTYVRSKPIASVQQLLPVYDYIFDSLGLRNYPSNYPVNSFLEDLNSAVSELTNSGVRMYNFVGNTSVLGTIVGINTVDTSEVPPKWEHGEPTGDDSFVIGTGDGTVATPSASYINENLVTKDTDHRILPAAAEGEIFEILTGDSPSILVNNPDTINFKLLLIKILSPADLLVVDPNSKKIGKESGVAINEIFNAFYTGFNTSTEYITILNPLDGEYKVITEGSGAGAYTVETAYISEQQTVEASFTGNTSPGLLTELNVSVNNANPAELEIEPSDSEPPVIMIVQPEARDYLRSEPLPINVSAQDMSGVFALETKLGTTTIPNVTIVDLFYEKLGNYTLIASSTDNVGNTDNLTQMFRVIATPASTLSDTDRAFQLGWMIQSVRDKLHDKLQTYIAKLEQSKKADKFILKDIFNELERQRGRGLNEQAYQLLNDDIQWLVNN
jgi:pimeloyl-ACP methyl ester carboxylesterase